MQTDSKLKQLLDQIKQPSDSNIGRVFENIQNLKKSHEEIRQEFYDNLVTYQWGPPSLTTFCNPSTDWLNEVHYDRRALIEDPTVLMLIWPHHQPIPQDIAHTADFLGHDFGCEFYSTAILRVRDEDHRWEWQQRFVPLDKKEELTCDH